TEITGAEYSLGYICRQVYKKPPESKAPTTEKLSPNMGIKDKNMNHP
ncbi:unnamed protein product, partial [Brassica rapa subsp. trilocularis]